ncbi:hypothetical protein [Zooshikella sp. RANM57]|uniref:hypothetical protein n=1 Tax=Zooshikella sp. RANM57 TaxID=3425863 RepID=UPI003D6E2D13
MLSFFEHTINVGPVSGGPTTIPVNVNITRPNPDSNARVVIVLKSFDVRFTNADHHLLRVFIRPELDGFGPFTSSVPIRLSVGMRDSSGSWDDQYAGTVQLGIIVLDDNRVDVFERTQRFSYEHGGGPNSETAFLQLNDPSATGVTFLQGFDIGFERNDHHVLQIMADVDDQTVDALGTRFDAVQCRLGLRDSSGFWDDPYGGSVLFSSLRFPIGTYAVEDGFITVQDVNKGPATSTANHFIQQNVPKERLFVGLTGFQCSYIGSDHHIHRLTSQVNIDQVQSDNQRTQVRIAYKGGIRDKSGEWDDQYASTGRYAVLAVTDQALNSSVTLPVNIFRRVSLPRRFSHVFPR